MEIYWKDDSCLVINSKEYKEVLGGLFPSRTSNYVFVYSAKAILTTY